MQMKVRTRHQVETSNDETRRHIIISMRARGTVEGERPAVVYNDKTEGVLYLEVDDLDHAPMPGSATWALLKGEFDLFNNFHAEAILSMIRATSPEVVVCHCGAGRSRSPGLAAALDKFYNGDDSRYFGTTAFSPNMLVYRTMLNYLQEKHDEAAQSREEGH